MAMSVDQSVIEQAFAVARSAAAAGARAALPFFHTKVDSSRKVDGSLVTAADLASEKAILTVLHDAFADHSILSEETGVHVGRSDRRWIVDPLDGTHRFARGVRFWGPLVAFELDGEIVAGAAALPALEETYTAAKGIGAFRNDEPIQVSTRTDWGHANVACGSLGRLLESPHVSGALDLIRRADYCLAGGDLEGALLVARGEAEIWIEFGVKPWDVAALKIIVEQAGGRFTDLAGAHDLTQPGFLASNGAMHDEALRQLKPTA